VRDCGPEDYPTGCLAQMLLAFACGGVAVFVLVMLLRCLGVG